MPFDFLVQAAQAAQAALGINQFCTQDRHPPRAVFTARRLAFCRPQFGRDIGHARNFPNGIAQDEAPRLDAMVVLRSSSAGPYST
jgi:hypothetical protein